MPSRFISSNTACASEKYENKQIWRVLKQKKINQHKMGWAWQIIKIPRMRCLLSYTKVTSRALGLLHLLLKYSSSEYILNLMCQFPAVDSKYYSWKINSMSISETEVLNSIGKFLAWGKICELKVTYCLRKGWTRTRNLSLDSKYNFHGRIVLIREEIMQANVWQAIQLSCMSIYPHEDQLCHKHLP